MPISFAHGTYLMPRPHCKRSIDSYCAHSVFRPYGLQTGHRGEVTLSHDELEALRLSDFEGLYQDAAARAMGISRQTFGRILAEARRSVADALIHGLALRIEGGDYRMRNDQLEQTAGGEAGAIMAHPAAHTPQRKSNMRKIAVSSEGPTLDSPVDPRFGRAAGFVIIDPETMAFFCNLHTEDIC